jgi:hypothetical protein
MPRKDIKCYYGLIKTGWQFVNLAANLDPPEYTPPLLSLAQARHKPASYDYTDASSTVSRKKTRHMTATKPLLSLFQRGSFRKSHVRMGAHSNHCFGSFHTPRKRR